MHNQLPIRISFLIKRDQYAIVKDYIMWRVVDAYVSSMPSAFVEAKLKYVQTIRGVQPFSRSSYCIMGIMKPLGMTLARLYVDTSFDESSKSTVSNLCVFKARVSIFY